MSVKFEIADWSFEITLKELICQPIKTEKTGVTAERWEDLVSESADNELLSDCYGREQGLIL